ncbi:hypothetical protein IT407_00260 [Candidatus Uhrbacteria bacterium]|nr:hypothetical protein [Candidatus Uhrbacteria bacterium]
MKRLFSLLASAALLTSPLLGHAATLSAGDLIKASGPAVYYYSNDGKRYVFPSERVFYTWYSGFGTVKTISDAELAALQIGGNVTYRPGTRMVKIMTDPKVYAVAARGTLRWVQTESVARELYGDTWSSFIDDVSDSLFVNYTIGLPISNSSDYNRVQAIADATSIDADRTTPAPTPEPTPTPTPTPEPSYTGSIDLSVSEASVNELVQITAAATPSTNLSSVKMYFGTDLIKTCFATPCQAEWRMPGSGDSFPVRADFVWSSGQNASATKQILLNYADIPGVTMTVTTPQVKPSGIREIIVVADSAQFSPRSIEIYIDGNAKRICDSVNECRWTDLESDPVGTVHNVYAILRDGIGLPRQTPVKTITVVTNPGPYVTVTPGKNRMYTGETLDATVSASDEDGISTTEIWVDGVKIKSCQLSTCTSDMIGPWPTPRTVYITGRSQDLNGAFGYGTSSIIVVDRP